MRIDEYGIRRIQEQIETKANGGDSSQCWVLSLKNKNTTLTLHATASQEEQDDQEREKGFSKRNNPNKRDRRLEE